MKDLDVNILISILLGVMGIIAVVIWGIISWKSGTSSGTEVPLSIASSLGGVLTGKGLAEAKYAKMSTTTNPPKESQENFSESVKRGAE